MTNPFHRNRRTNPASLLEGPSKAHMVESDFCYSKCRFIVACSCGATLETRYIDEALEWSSMHRELAPLTDAMTEANSFHV